MKKLIIIPAFIGGLMFFYNRKSIIAKLLGILGCALLLISIITCIIITFGKYTILQYVFFGIFELIGVILVIISFINKED